MMMKITQQYYCMRFYVTYRCNSRCGYCNVWQEEQFQSRKELSLEAAKDLIRQCFDAGVRYIDFTGGEPTLNKSLPELVEYAKTLGIKTEVTSNAAQGCTENLIQIAERADKFNISLDTLQPETYIKIRGVDCFYRVKEAVDGIVKIRAPKLMMVVSEDNVGEMDSMIQYAQEKGAEIYLNPVFSYFIGGSGTLSADRSFSIRSKIFEPCTVVMLHFMEFIKENGAKDHPPCSANNRTLTFAPNGDLLLPCYHEFRETIPWKGCLKEMLESDTFQKYAEISGNAEYCKACAVVPYFGISFAYSLDRWFLLQSYSEKLHHLKRDFLNQMPEIWGLGTDLNGQLEELLVMIRSLDPQKKTQWLYEAKQTKSGVQTRIYSRLLTLEQYQREQKATDCWQLELVPHTGFDRIYEFVYRKAYSMYIEGNTGKDILYIFQNAMEFQLRWWKLYISRNMQVSIKCNIDREQCWTKAYLHFLADWGKRNHCHKAATTAERLMADYLNCFK